MRLSERQRAFLQDAARKGAWIAHRRSWHSVIVESSDGPRVGASIRGADLVGLMGLYLHQRGGELLLTAQGERIGKLYALYNAAVEMYEIGYGVGPDVEALIASIEKQVWAKVQEAEEAQQWPPTTV